MVNPSSLNYFFKDIFSKIGSENARKTTTFSNFFYRFDETYTNWAWNNNLKWMNIDILIDTAIYMTWQISSAVKFNELHCWEMGFFDRDGYISSFILQSHLESSKCAQHATLLKMTQ